MSNLVKGRQGLIAKQQQQQQVWSGGRAGGRSSISAVGPILVAAPAQLIPPSLAISALCYPNLAPLHTPPH
jgi:hypothetical protein